MYHENAEMFAGLIENAPFGIFVIDSDFRLVQISEGARKVFSVVPNPIGSDFADVLSRIWPEPFLSDALSRFRHTLATGESFHGPTTVQNRAVTGHTEAYDWKIDRVAGTDGRYGVVCYFFDMTEQQQRHDTLRQAAMRDQFRASLDDALHELSTAEHIWYRAACVLGEHLKASRVAWSEEVGDGEHFLVLPHYVDGATQSTGRFRYSDYGAGIFEQLRAGNDRIQPDIANDATLSDYEKQMLAVHGIGASLTVPVIKQSRLAAFLSVHYPTAHNFSFDEIELVHAVAQRTCSAALRAQAEAALRHSEENYRALFDSIDQGYCVVQVVHDSEGRAVDYLFEQINPAFSELTGLPSESVGRTACELVPNLEPFWAETYGRVAATGEPVRFENESKALERWFDVYALRLGAREDKRVGILFTNVTARKTRELHARFLDGISQELAHLSTSEEIMQRVGTRVGEFLNLSGCVFADVDESKNEVTVHTGWMSANVPSLKQQTFKLAEYVTPEFTRANRAGESFVVNNSATDGRTDAAQYAQLQIGAFATVPVLRNGNWVAYLVATSVTPRQWRPEEVLLLREVSERLFTRIENARAESAMRESEERLQLAINIGAFASWDWDLNTGVIKWNDRHYSLQGYKPGEVQPSFEAWWARVHPDDREGTIACMEEARASKTTYIHDYRNQWPNGEVIWCSARGRFLYDEQGKPYRMIGVMDDITERKRSEQHHRALLELSDLLRSAHEHEQATAEALSLLQQTLGAPVRSAETTGDHYQITAELQNGKPDELRLVEQFAERMSDARRRWRAERALQAADRRKDEFLATLAHELRNPLAPIRNGVELLRITGTRTAEEQNLLGMVDRQLTHMVRLVDDLMDVSRISVGKLRLQHKPTPMQTVLEEAVEACRGVIAAAGHTLTQSASEPLPVLNVDCARLVQVLSNLLTNAARYTDRGGHIELRAFVTPEWMVFEVEDTGVGIPSSAHAGLFDLFSQVDGGARRSQGGLGIGLNLVKRLVELHDGQVGVRSELGQGSTFTVRIPLREVAMSQGNPELSTRSSVTRRVLIIDDNVDAAHTLAKILEHAGYELRIAQSGYDGVAASATFAPEVVVLDIGLPDIDGYVVARSIREQSGAHPPLLVALTGFGQDADKRRAQLAGFDYHFTKPVRAEEIRELIARRETRAVPVEARPA